METNNELKLDSLRVIRLWIAVQRDLINERKDLKGLNNVDSLHEYMIQSVTSLRHMRKELYDMI